LLHLPTLAEVTKDTITYWATRLKTRLDELS
jgi:hypothetical protein